MLQRKVFLQKAIDFILFKWYGAYTWETLLSFIYLINRDRRNVFCKI